MEHFLFISNRDSQDYYTANRPDIFTINCEQSICLPGFWTVALTEVSLNLSFNTPTRPDYLNIIVDFCQPSYIAGSYKQILRKIVIPAGEKYSEIFSRPYYFKVNVPELNKFLVTILNRDLDLSGFTGEISFTLHLKQSK